MIDLDTGAAHREPPPDRGPGPVSEGLVDALLERVALAATATRERVAAVDPWALAEGAGAVEVIALLESVVRTAQGLQADAIIELDARRREACGADVDERDLCRSLFAEIALARRTSSTAGETSYRLAQDLVDHPHVHALLRDGEVNQAVVAAVCHETVYLDPRARAKVDAELAPQLSDLGPKRAAAEARQLVIDHAPHAALERTVRAREDRHAWLRPELDAMATLTVYAPAEVLVPAWQRLDAEGRRPSSPDDPRTTAQRVCDRAVELLSGFAIDTEGRAVVGSGSEAEVAVGAPGVEVGLLMRPETLFGADDAAAVLHGYGPVPGELARDLATRSRSWVRRFFTSPDADSITDVDARRRRFPADIARMIRAADEFCSRPWCECRKREIDHTAPYARGGPTTADNADGQCRSDNLLKETRGWNVNRDASGARTWTTPTGHTYISAHIPFTLRIHVPPMPDLEETTQTDHAAPPTPDHAAPPTPGLSEWESPIEAELERLIAEQTE